MKHYRHVKETLERQYDNPKSGFIIETPYMSASEAAKYEGNGVTLLRSGNVTKFYAEDNTAVGRLVEELTKPGAIAQHALYNKYDEKIVIYSADNRMNDSLGEKKVFENRIANSPKSYFKRDIIKRILKGELERSEDVIKGEFAKTTLWDNVPERIRQNDLKFIMMKTHEDESDNVERTFITNFTFVADDDDYVSEVSALKATFGPILNNDAFDVKFKWFSRKPTVLIITYNSKYAHDELVKFLQRKYLEGIYGVAECRKFVEQGYFLENEEAYREGDIENSPLLTWDEYVETQKNYEKNKRRGNNYADTVTVHSSGGSVDN